MNYETLASELVRALRGKRSQGALNRRLGHSSNVAHTWERGTRQPRASAFFKLARLSQVDVEQALLTVAALSEPEAGPAIPNARRTAMWLRALARGRSQLELARSIGRNRNTVARWLAGSTEPRLPDLLRWVDACTHRLIDFVRAFVDPDSLPSVRAIHGDLERQRRIAYDLPWAHAVLRTLELDEYARLARHEEGFIARRIRISVEEEERCLQALARARQIRRWRGKWALRRVMTVDTSKDAEANLRLKLHWARVGVERIEHHGLPPQSLYSYNLFAISDEGLEQIKQAHLAYYERLRMIVAECKRPTRLALANVQLIPLDV